MEQVPFKSGFISIVGKPNVGKSSLDEQTNAGKPFDCHAKSTNDASPDHGYFEW